MPDALATKGRPPDRADRERRSRLDGAVAWVLVLLSPLLAAIDMFEINGNDELGTRAVFGAGLIVALVTFAVGVRWLRRPRHDRVLPRGLVMLAVHLTLVGHYEAVVALTQEHYAWVGPMAAAGIVGLVLLLVGLLRLGRARFDDR